MIIFGNKDELQFESINDFKWCLKCGGEIEFDWNGKSYGIGHDEKELCFMKQTILKVRNYLKPHMMFLMSFLTVKYFVK